MNRASLRIILCLSLGLFLAPMGCSDDTTTGDGGTETPTGPDPTNPTDPLNPDPTTCVDADGDGHLGFVAGVCDTGTDCNDNDISAYPGAPEICGNGVDNACNGEADESCCTDTDGDTFSGWSLECPNGDDCDDTNPSMYPGAPETVGDGIDQDCNGYDSTCAEDCNAIQCGLSPNGCDCGECGEGAICNAAQECEFETLPEDAGSCADRCGTYDSEASCQCDSLCVGAGDCCEDICVECIDELPGQCGCEDLDGDGYGAGPDCAGPDCNDEDADVNPGVDEIECNDKDDNCDEIDFCEETPVDECTEELDEDGDGFCKPEDCDDTDKDINPSGTDQCDKTDNNCDGVIDACPEVDCIDQDGDGYGEGTECPQTGADCNDKNPTVNPGVLAAADLCGDGIDQDCDGVDPDCPENCTDADGDGFFEITDECEDSDDCSDLEADIYPDATDVCGDGIDQDCNGVDAECPTPTGDCTVDADCDAGMWCDSSIGDGACVWPKLWQWWAPVVYVDTPSNNSKLGWDFFTNVDYDGDAVAGNNGDHIDDYDKDAWVYYSFVKTDTHAYLGYHFYFPQRWNDALVGGSSYENVTRSVLLTVRFGDDVAEPYGTLEMMQTTTENSIYMYLPEDSPLYGTMWADGTVSWNNEGGHARPNVYIYSESHNIYGDDGWEDGFPGDNGFIFRWDFEAGTPKDLIGETTYAMVPLVDTLWADREQIGDTKMYEVFGMFAGDDASNSESVTPWAHDDEQLLSGEPAGEMLYDPATFVRRYFQEGWGPFNTQYAYNPYPIRVDIHDLKVKTSGGFLDGDVDPYVNLFLRDGLGKERLLLGNAGNGLVNNWEASDAEENTLFNLKTELGRYWFYGINYPGADYFGIEVRDNDFWNIDDWLMDPEERDYLTFTGIQLLDWVKSDSVITVHVP